MSTERLLPLGNNHARRNYSIVRERSLQGLDVLLPPNSGLPSGAAKLRA